MKKTVEIVNLNHQGKGIGKIDGKVIFVSNAYLGEVVEVEVIKDNKKYMEGKVLKYKDNEYVIQYFDCCTNPRIVAAPINKREPWYEKDNCRDWVYIDIDEEYIITNEMFENRYKKIKEMEEENVY